MLLLNNCRSREVAGQLARRARGVRRLVAEVELHGASAHVGTALMDAACERLHRVGRPDGPILPTDAA